METDTFKRPDGLPPQQDVADTRTVTKFDPPVAGGKQPMSSCRPSCFPGLVWRIDGYWIVDIPGAGDCGPYGRRADAIRDRRGMLRALKHSDDRRFFTVD